VWNEFLPDDNFVQQKVHPLGSFSVILQIGNFFKVSKDERN
jgi:hypothetical protein